jgi:hypothetical protein
LTLALVLALPGQAWAEPPSRQEVQKAVEVVKKNPDLGGTITQKTLRFKDRERKKKDKPDSNGLEWLKELGRWLSETGRLLVWVAGALLVAFVLLGIRRWIKVRGGMAAAPRPHLPSHVQSLDIRPESLPDAIGATAAQLWSRGQHRPALSLLYRGALSRLVHTHAVAIQAASTEGECLVLARGKLDLPRSDFFAQLVGAWQVAVYGGRLPDEQHALGLCQAFDLHLPAHVQGLAVP